MATLYYRPYTSEVRVGTVKFITLVTLKFISENMQEIKIDCIHVDILESC